MNKKGLPRSYGCSARFGTWLCTHHSLDGKMHLAFGSHDLACDPWPIENMEPAPIRAEVIEILEDIYPEWSDA